MESQYMGDKSGHEEKREDDPMAAKTVEKKITGCDCHDKRSVEPEEHPHVVRWPEVLRYPLNKAAVEQRFVKNVDDVWCKKCPEENA